MSLQFKRILVVLDPVSQRQPALVRALGLARALGCPLEALVCIYDKYLAGERFTDSEGLQKARGALAEETRGWLRGKLAEHDTSGVQLDLHVAWGSPLSDEILQRAARTGADLIVKDTHHHAVLERGLFSNTDWDLLRGFPRALWLVKPVPWPQFPVIVASVDPTHEHDKPGELDMDILEVAEILKQAHQGTLYAVHAFPLVTNSTLVISAIPGTVGYPLEVSPDLVEREHRAALADLLSRRPIQPDHVRFVAGYPRDVILEQARENNANLVVMGVVSRRALKRWVLGCTAEQVLDALPCDILAVRRRTPAGEDE